MQPIALSVLIPTYNEEDIIETALVVLSREMNADLVKKTEVLIVDDGRDGLPEVVAKIKSRFPFVDVAVYRNSPPLGKGKSLALGFQKARGEIVGFLDVDLSTPPRYINQAYEAIHSGKTDIFIGSRRAGDSVVKREQLWLKDVLGHGLGVIARAIIFSGMQSYRDTQCGFKFYPNKVAKLLYHDLVAPDGLNDLEVLLRANLAGYGVLEQGVQWTDLRESKRTLRRILLGEIAAMLRILMHYKLLAGRKRENLRVWAQELGLSLPQKG